MHRTHPAPPLLNVSLGLAALAALSLCAARPAAAQVTITFDGLPHEPTFTPEPLSVVNRSNSLAGVTFSGWDVLNTNSSSTLNPAHSGSYDAINDGGGTALLSTTRTLDSLYLGNAGNATSGLPPLVSVTITAGDASSDLRSDVFTFTPYQGLTLESTDFAGLPGITGYRFSQVVAGRNNFAADDLTFDAPAAVPEPSQAASLGLAALGVLGLLARARRRRTA